MYIQQGNLTIRNAVAADGPLLGKWWRDGEVMAHAGFPRGLDISDEEIVADLAQDSDEKGRRLIIEAGGLQIGEMSYRNMGKGTAEIGIKICVSCQQGRGHGPIFLSMLIDALFNRGYHKICLDTNLNNKRAQHVYQALGFEKVRVNCDAWRDQLGRLQSSVDYELSNEAWKGIQQVKRTPRPD